MDTPAEQAARMLAWDLESRTSIEILVRTEITQHQPDPKKKQVFNRITDHYIETAAGQRFNEFRGRMGESVTSRGISYSDGSRFAHVDYDPDDTDVQKTIFLMRQYWQEDRSDRRELPVPLLFQYVAREPLHRALPRAEYEGEGEVLGRKCDIFLFPSVRWLVTQDQVFYLDKQTAVPLKVEAYRDRAARERDEPMWVWTAESLDEVNGHFVTRKSTQIAYDATKRPLITWKVYVESIEFDKSYPNSIFWPSFQPGATVYDALSGKVSEVPGAPKQSAVAPSQVGGTGQPIEAVAPTDWFAYMPGLMLGAGCAVLVVAGFLWWRNR